MWMLIYLSDKGKRIIENNILTNQSYIGNGKYIGYLNSYKKSNNPNYNYKIDLKTKKETNLFPSSNDICNIEISSDNTQLLYRTAKELGIADVSKARINIYDFKSKMRFRVFESHYFDAIETICWGE